MRYKLFYDENRKIPLYSVESRERAIALAESEKQSLSVALYPSLFADVGAVFCSDLWGREVTPEGLRAVGFYFGRVLGWPFPEITVECEGERVLSIPLYGVTENLSVKTKICKQLFENICIYSHSVSHSAVLFSPPFSFVLVESEECEAVNFAVAEELRADREIGDLPLCFASLKGEKMQLRVMRRGKGEVEIDDRLCLSVLSYFIETERAAYGREYSALGGKYRIEQSRAAEAVRSLEILG